MGNIEIIFFIGWTSLLISIAVLVSEIRNSLHVLHGIKESLSHIQYRLDHIGIDVHEFMAPEDEVLQSLFEEGAGRSD